MDKPKELTAADIFAFVLYVSSRDDPLVRDIRQRGLSTLVYIQLIDDLQERPSWLRGTTLVDTDNSTGYRGAGIQQFLDEYKVPSHLRNKANSAQKKASRWELDREMAESEVFDERLAPIHVRK
jgi:hypothetical protein